MRELHRRVRARLTLYGVLFMLAATFTLLGSGQLIVLSLSWFWWQTAQCLRARAGLCWLERQREAVQAKVAANPESWIDRREWALLTLPE